MRQDARSQHLMQLAANHRRQLALCAELEEIADSLPGRVDRHRCLQLAQELCPIIRQAQELEERALFPAIQALAGTFPNLDASVERLRWEHFEDLTFGEDIRDALFDLGRGGDRLAADVLGYMLRGFFEGMRRHVAFEREMLLPLLDDVECNVTGGTPQAQ